MEVQVLSTAFRGIVFLGRNQVMGVGKLNVHFFLAKIILCGKIGGMNVIYTNRDQRPKKYSLEAADVADRIGSTLTKGRVRQIARGYKREGPQIGWIQFKVVCPVDGKHQFPFNQNHKYSQDDVATVVEWIEKVHLKDQRYTLKLNRWYCEADIPKVVEHSKRLTKKIAAGELEVVGVK